MSTAIKYLFLSHYFEVPAMNSDQGYVNGNMSHYALQTMGTNQG
jgi:hypothetical protein